MATSSVTPRVLLGSKDVFVQTSRFRFSASGFATGASAFDDRVCLGSCVILLRRSCAWSQIVPRSVSTCPRAVTWLTVYRALQVAVLCTVHCSVQYSTMCNTVPFCQVGIVRLISSDRIGPIEFVRANLIPVELIRSNRFRSIWSRSSLSGDGL